MHEQVSDTSCVNCSTPVIPKTSVDLVKAITVHDLLQDSKSHHSISDHEAKEFEDYSISVAEVSSTNDNLKKSVRFSDPPDHVYDLSKLIHNHILRTSIIYRERHARDTRKTCGARLSSCIPRSVIIGLLSLMLCLGVAGATLGVLHSQGIINMRSSVGVDEPKVAAINSSSFLNNLWNQSFVTPLVFTEFVSTEDYSVTTPLIIKEVTSKSRFDSILHLLSLDGPLQKYSYNNHNHNHVQS